MKDQKRGVAPLRRGGLPQLSCGLYGPNHTRDMRGSVSTSSLLPPTLGEANARPGKVTTLRQKPEGEKKKGQGGRF